MAVSNVIVKKSKQELPFPKYMETTKGLIVLFDAAGRGTVICPDQNWKVAVYSKGWDMTAFEDFEGEIICKNVPF